MYSLLVLYKVKRFLDLRFSVFSSSTAFLDTSLPSFIAFNFGRSLAESQIQAEHDSTCEVKCICFRNLFSQ